MLQLKFDAIDGAENLAMHLLYHGRVAGKTTGIELLHLPRQVLHVFGGLRVALHHLPELVQLAHALLIVTLRVGGIAGGVKLWRSLWGRLTIAVVTRVDVAPDGAVRAASPAVAYVTTLSIALAGAVSRRLPEACSPLQIALCELA